MKDTQVTLGQRIRHYRKMKNITQKELASELGVAPNYIACIEQGVKSPSLEKLTAICRWFGVGMSDILPIEGQESVKVKEKWIDEIVTACRGMDASQVRLLKTMVCSLHR